MRKKGKAPADRPLGTAIGIIGFSSTPKELTDLVEKRIVAKLVGTRQVQIIRTDLKILFNSLTFKSFHDSDNCVAYFVIAIGENPDDLPKAGTRILDKPTGILTSDQPMDIDATIERLINYSPELRNRRR